jgi:hypothetical protein
LFEVELGYAQHAGHHDFFYGGQFGAGLKIKLPVVGIFFVLFGLELALGAKHLVLANELESEVVVKAYVGFGAGIDVGIGSLEISVAVGVVVIYEAPTFKVGGLVLIEGELDIKIIKIVLKAELLGVIYEDPADPARQLVDYGGEVALQIVLFHIFSITLSYGVQDTKQLR